MGRKPHPDLFTPAEQRVLEHIRSGQTNAEIAVRLGISVNTVKYHVANMLAKTGASERSQLPESVRPLQQHVARRRPGRSLVLLLGSLVGTLAAGAAIGALLLAGSGEAGETRPDWPPHGLLVWLEASTVDGDGTRLLAMTLPASAARTLTAVEQGAHIWGPSLAPDGRRVALFQSFGPDTISPELGPFVATLRVLDLGTGGSRISSGQAAGVLEDPLGREASPLEFPSWRPDGQRIAYGSQSFLTATADADGNFEGDRRLGCRTPSWGTGSLATCALVSAPDEAGGIQVGYQQGDFRFERQPGVPEPTWVFIVQGQARYPAVSPDGNWVAWAVLKDGRSRIWVAENRPGGQKWDVAPGHRPRWSPTANRLVFSDARHEEAEFATTADGDILVLEMESDRPGKPKRVRHDGDDAWPAWSPDGEWIAFVSDRDHAAGEIYLMRRDGSDLGRLTVNDRAESQLDWGRDLPGPLSNP